MPIFLTFVYLMNILSYNIILIINNINLESLPPSVSAASSRWRPPSLWGAGGRGGCRAWPRPGGWWRAASGAPAPRHGPGSAGWTAGWCDSACGPWAIVYNLSIEPPEQFRSPRTVPGKLQDLGTQILEDWGHVNAGCDMYPLCVATSLNTLKLIRYWDSEKTVTLRESRWYF